jgi:hypothetical protein
LSNEARRCSGDFDVRFRDDPAALFEQLTNDWKAFWINTGADGDYLLHAYVNEPLPSSLRPYVREPLGTEHLEVPSGQLYFTGAEYGFRDEGSFLREHPQMGGAFVVPPGVYRLTLWRAEYPDGLQEELLRQQVSPMAFQLYQGMGLLVTIAVLGTLGFMASIAWVPRSTWLQFLLPVWAFFVLVPFAAARHPSYRDACARFRDVKREFPSIVAELEFKECG